MSTGSMPFYLGTVKKVLTGGAPLVRALAVSLLILLIGTSVLFAQVDAGAILGTITDSSGAVIPNVKVTLTNEDTGLVVTTMSRSAGEYSFAPIKIGRYSLIAEAQGFERVEHTHVTVDVQQHALLNIVLPPGPMTQTVMVTAELSGLQTQDASVGQVIEAQTINTLPLNGRNFTFLAQLSAGVTQNQQDTRGLGASGSFAANGLQPSQNNYLLDGLDNNSNLVDFLNGSSFAIRPPIDAIQEFKIQTNNYSAEFGRSAGAVLNASIKSGTNKFHGDAWEFVRNDLFDAANYFEAAGGIRKGKYRQNQFGATIGGPIWKDKTFFFADYEGTRIRQGVPYVTTVPTALERSSGYTDLSELLNQGGTQTDVTGRNTALGQVFDPSTTRAVEGGFTREIFPGNILPATRLDQNAIKLLNLYPAPINSQLINNFTTNPVMRNDVNQFDVRIDQTFRDKDQIFGRGSYSTNPQYLPGPFPGIADGGKFVSGNQATDLYSWVVGETHTFSPTLVNEVRGGINNMKVVRSQPYANTFGIPQQFGIQGIPQVRENGGLSKLNIAGLGTLGGNGYLPSDESSRTLQISDNVTKQVKRQTLTAGFEFQRLDFSILQPAAGRGNFSFSGLYTEVPTYSSGGTGLAQLLLSPTPGSLPGAADYVGGADAVGASNVATTNQTHNYYGAYLQDDYQITSKLTLNLGLRWEYFGQIIETNDEQSNFVLPTPVSNAQFLLPQSTCKTPFSPAFYTAAAADKIDIVCSSLPGLGHSQRANFSPRVGFAYQVAPKLVVRGAYGIFYGGFSNSTVETYVDFPFQFALGRGYTTPNQPITYANGSTATLENGLSALSVTPNAVDPLGVSFTGEDFHMQTPYTEGYNLMMQYQVASNDSIQVGYVGNSVRHLGVYVNPNAPSGIYDPSLNAFDYSPYPHFQNTFTVTRFSGDSSYNSLQATYEHRFNQGLSILANYTWSKCRTDAVDVLNATAISGRNAYALPHFGLQGDYGLCDFDIRNVVHLSGTYELPVGNGRRFLANSSWIVNTLLGGWSTNWILPLQGGQPGTVPCNVSTTAGFGCNANVVPGQSVLAKHHNANQWLNPAAFASPPVATGAMGQTTDYSSLGGRPSQYTGPPFRRLDISLFKNIPTPKGTHLEFRAEAFSLTNTPNFSNPSNLDYSSNTFGRISSTRDGQNDPRELQFALKFYW